MGAGSINRWLSPYAASQRNRAANSTTPCLPIPCAAAAHGGVCTFHLGTSRLVATLTAHSKNVRGLCYDAQHNLLLTCSFDRSVKLWEAATAAAGTEAGHASPPMP